VTPSTFNWSSFRGAGQQAAGSPISGLISGCHYTLLEDFLPPRFALKTGAFHCPEDPAPVLVRALLKPTVRDGCIHRDARHRERNVELVTGSAILENQRLAGRVDANENSTIESRVDGVPCHFRMQSHHRAGVRPRKDVNRVKLRSSHWIVNECDTGEGTSILEEYVAKAVNC